MGEDMVSNNAKRRAARAAASPPVVLVQTEPDGVSPPPAAVEPRSVSRLGHHGKVALGGLYQASQDLEHAQHVLQRQVAVARREGASWDAIGWSLGLSGEACRLRWAKSSADLIAADAL